MINISNKEELRKLIARYVKGKASNEEITFLKKYYDHYGDQDDGLEELTENERSQLKSQIFNVIRHKLNPYQQRKANVIKIYKIAAAVIVVIIAAGVFWYSKRNVEPLEEVLVQEQLNLFLVDTAISQNKHIYLPDGSYVLLKPGSQLEYLKGFNDVERIVELEGEAYFDVRHDTTRPFVVNTNGVTTRVLGTAFSISSSDKNNKFTISVTRGKVEVSDQSQQLGILQKNDQLILDMVTHNVAKNKLKEEETSVIEPAQYMMDDMTVAEAIGIVSQRWECQFKLKDEALKSCRFTSSFSPADNLEEVVAVISLVIGAEYSIKDNIVSLYGKGCEN